MKVIIFDAETRSALAALRALHEKDVQVIAISHRSNALSFFSRTCKEKQICPNVLRNRTTFIAWLAGFLKTQSGVLCMSFTDHTTDALQYGMLQGIIPRDIGMFPTYKDYERATNKRHLADLAHSLNIPTLEEISYHTLDTHNNAHIVFPLIIKPVRSVSWLNEIAYKDTAHKVETLDALFSMSETLTSKTHSKPLVQKIISGDEFGVSVLAHNGVVKMCFAHRRLRSIHTHGGVSALRESVLLTDEMKNIAERLSHALNWQGVMMIELKRDNATGKLTLVEVNARFWGSLFLAICADANFPYALYRLHTGIFSHESSNAYRIGIQARHMISDISHYYAQGKKALRPKNLLEFFTFWRKGLYYDVLSWTDPLPGIAELVQFIRKKI